MNPIKPSQELSREEIVSVCLRQCALIIDPRYGKLAALAEEFDLHVNTLTLWQQNGRIPHKACKRLLKRFGKRLVDFDLLTQGA